MCKCADARFVRARGKCSVGSPAAHGRFSVELHTHRITSYGLAPKVYQETNIKKYSVAYKFPHTVHLCRLTSQGPAARQSLSWTVVQIMRGQAERAASYLRRLSAAVVAGLLVHA